MPVPAKKAPAKKAAAPKLSGIGTFRDKLHKQYGTNLTRQDTQPQEYKIVSTGSLALDYATVVGGWVKGRIHLLYGPEGCGKTTTSICSMAKAQEDEPTKAVGYIDMEQTFDFEWAQKHGLDTSEERFIHVFPENSEDVADLMKEMCRSGVISMVVVDSVGGMVTKKAIDADAEKEEVGKNAKIITRMCQITAVEARKAECTVLIISQMRAIISATGGETFAAPKALRHATTMVVKFRKSDKAIMATVDKEQIPVGQQFSAKVERSKVSAGGRTGTLTIRNVATKGGGPVGIDIVDEAWTVGLKPSVGAIKQSGAWYTLPDESRHNGEEKSRIYFTQHPEVVDMVWKQAIESVRGFVQPEEAELTFVPGDELAEANETTEESA